jgi:putative peptidoglycan lipid II flippase
MSLTRDVTTVGSATLVSRLLAFVRDMGIAAVLGAGVASDAFFAALQIPNLARRLLAEGALNAAFVPMWLRIKDSEGEIGAWRFAQRIAGAMLVLAGAAVGLGLVFAPTVIRLIAPGFETGDERHALAAAYLQLILPYVGIASIVAILAAVLNAEGRVGAASLGVVAFNGIMLAALAFIIAFAPGTPAAIGATLCHAVVIAGLVQFVVTGWAVWRLMRTFRRAASQPAATSTPAPTGDVYRFFAQAIPGVFAAGVPQLTLIIGAMVASASPNAVSWLYYANRLYELPLGVVSVAVSSVMVPLIAASLRTRDDATFAGAQSRAYEIALGLALPAAAALGVLAMPIAGVLFERGAFGPQDTQAVASALAAMCAGLPGHALDKVLGAVAFAHEDTRTPMVTAGASLGAAAVAAIALFPAFGLVGIATAIALAGWTGAIALAVVLGRRGWLRIDPQGRRRLPRIAAATIGMAVGLILLHGALAPAGRLVSLVLLIPAGLVGYGALLHVLGVARIPDLVAAIRKTV